MNASDHLLLLKRYAAFAFGADAGGDAIRQYRRVYLRKVLRWRVAAPRSLYERHLAVVKDDDERALLWQFLDAVADWPLTRLGLRRPRPPAPDSSPGATPASDADEPSPTAPQPPSGPLRTPPLAQDSA